MESYGNNSGIIVACVAIIIFMHVRVHDELAKHVPYSLSDYVASIFDASVQ